MAVFTTQASPGWPTNPLPLALAAAALGLPPAGQMRAQVFQNAICNWRCWYCYVPFSLLSGNPRRAAWFTATDLVDAYLAGPDPPPILDLSGGQPDLVPEWAPWTLQALDDRGADHVYVWSDDNLSTDDPVRGPAPADRRDLPLRTVPLEIEVWGPVAPRIGSAHQQALRVQAEAIAAWNTEIAARFTGPDRRRPVTEIRLRAGCR